MVPKIFLDTNIIIDFLEQRAFDLNSTNQLFTLIENNDIQAFVSESVITNTIYITNPADHIRLLLNIIDVICIKKDTIKMAIKSNFKDKEDGILYHGALDNKIDYFITRNKKDFIKYALKQLPVLTPKEMLITMKT